MVLDSGFGVIAKRNISQGESIIIEDPAFVLLDSERDKKFEVLERQFKEMKDDLKKKVLALYDSNPNGPEDMRIWRIFESNSIQVILLILLTNNTIYGKLCVFKGSTPERCCSVSRHSQV